MHQIWTLRKKQGEVRRAGEREAREGIVWRRREMSADFGLRAFFLDTACRRFKVSQEACLLPSGGGAFQGFWVSMLDYGQRIGV